jgi:hypothetical protein
VAASDESKVEEFKNIMRTSILTCLVPGFMALSLAACSGASSEPVDQSAQAETAGLSTASAPAASGSATPGPRGHRGPPDPAALVKRFDKNGDGILQVSELPEHMQKFLGKADTNGDGIITLDELKAAEDKWRAERLAKVDTNGDGTISPEERKAAFEKFAQARFAKLDKNGDGVLTKDEVGDKRWEHLSVADADKSGSVTEAEIRTAIAAGTLKFPQHGRYGHHGDRDATDAPPAATDPSAPTAPAGS